MTPGLALAQSRRIAPALLAQLEQSAREKKSQLIDEIIGSGTMSAHDVAIFAADKYQLPLLDLAQYNLNRVPPALAGNREFHAHRLLPLGRRENRLIVALSDPTNQAGVDAIKQKFNLPVETVVVEHDKLMKHVRAAGEALGTMKNISPGDAHRHQDDRVRPGGGRGRRPQGRAGQRNRRRPPWCASSRSC